MNHGRLWSHDSHSEGLTRSGGDYFAGRSRNTLRVICLTAVAAVGTPDRKEAPAQAREEARDGLPAAEVRQAPTAPRY